MKITLQYCNANDLALNESFIERLRSAFPDIEIEGISCLGYCALCARYPYVLLNKQKITAANPEELFDIISERIRK